MLEHKCGKEIEGPEIEFLTFGPKLKRPLGRPVIARRRLKKDERSGFEDIFEPGQIQRAFDMENDIGIMFARGPHGIAEKNGIVVPLEASAGHVNPHALAGEVFQRRVERPVMINHKSAAALRAGTGQFLERGELAFEASVGDIETDPAPAHLFERRERNGFFFFFEDEGTVVEIGDDGTASFCGVVCQNEFSIVLPGEVGGVKVGARLRQLFELDGGEPSRIDELQTVPALSAGFHGIKEGIKIELIVADDDASRVSGTSWICIALRVHRKKIFSLFVSWIFYHRVSLSVARWYAYVKTLAKNFY